MLANVYYKKDPVLINNFGQLCHYQSDIKLIQRKRSCITELCFKKVINWKAVTIFSLKGSEA